MTTPPIARGTTFWYERFPLMITTRQSASGFIATDPQLTFTKTGDARFYARIGQAQSRREEDGTFTELDPEFTDLVMFRTSAERAFEQFVKGDSFIAEGEMRSYMQNVDGQPVRRDQFLASRIGHDNNLTTYEVNREPRQEPVTADAVSQDAVAADRVSPDAVGHEPPSETPVTDAIREALGQRQEALDPEPPEHAAVSTGAQTLSR